jgi:16S rRNA (cytidine1402-2'-O)-methyltransferase
VLSGFDLRGLSFEGFVPRNAAARERSIRAALARGVATAYYETPHRILATLGAIEQIAPDLRVFLVRELSKLYEQQVLGNAAEVRAALAEPVQGEICLVLERGAERAPPEPGAREIDQAIDARIAAGESTSEIARALADCGAGTRREIYSRVTARKPAARKTQ